jgi:hypothetical protein
LAAKPPAPKQRCHSGLVARFLHSASYPLSIRDIARGCSIIPGPIVTNVLDELEQAKHVGRNSDTSLGINLLSSTQDSGKLAYMPIYQGAMAADEPLPAPHSEKTNVALTESPEVSVKLTDGSRDVYAL